MATIVIVFAAGIVLIPRIPVYFAGQSDDSWSMRHGFSLLCSLGSTGANGLGYCLSQILTIFK